VGEGLGIVEVDRHFAGLGAGAGGRVGEVSTRVGFELEGGGRAAAPAAAAAPVAAAGTAAAAPAKKKVSAKASASKKKSAAQKFTIDCSEPAADEIFDIASFEKFLHDRIKIGGKTGVLGEAIQITRDAAQLTITSKIHISKRYLKYLTKKFLKKQLLRDYIRVIARSKNGYFLRYFNFHQDEEAADE